MKFLGVVAWASSCLSASAESQILHNSDLGKDLYKQMRQYVFHSSDDIPSRDDHVGILDYKNNTFNQDSTTPPFFGAGLFCPPPVIFAHCGKTSFQDRPNFNNAGLAAKCFGGRGTKIGPNEKSNPHDQFLFQMPLPIPGVMPKSDLSTADIDVYEIEVVEYKEAEMIKGFKQTVYTFRAKGHEAKFPPDYLEFEAEKEFRVKFINKLVNEDGTHVEHFTKIDQTLHWADPACDHHITCNPEPYKGPIPLSIHMHGFNTTEQHEGHPDAWFLPNAKGVENYTRHGKQWDSFRKTSPACDLWDIDSAVSMDTPMRASTRWFHDHTVGMTRNNVFMGLASFAITVGGKYDSTKLPKGEFDLPLMISDRSFDKDGQMSLNEWEDLPGRNFTENYTGGENFQLPACGTKTCNGSNPPSDLPIFWVQQYYGITNTVNGAVWPFHEVKAGCYRLRLLNAALTRIYELKFFGSDPDKALRFNVIAGDSGFIHKSGIIEDDGFHFAPGERIEILIDFTKYAGQDIILRNEFYCYDTFKHNIGQVMKFKVSNDVVDSCPSLDVLQTSDIIPRQPDEILGTPLNGIVGKTHEIKLYNEGSNSVITNPLVAIPPLNYSFPDIFFEQCGVEISETNSYESYRAPKSSNGLLGQNPFPMHFKMGDMNGGYEYKDPITEYANREEVQEWVIENRSGTPHPIHIHALDQFKVVSRDFYDGEKWVGPLEPLPHEGPGWAKDTVLTYHNTRTKLHTYHEVSGNFVFHCHIITHEDRDMMRPFCVLNKDGSTPESCILQDENVQCKKVGNGLKMKAKKGKQGKATTNEHFILPACPKKSGGKMKSGKQSSGKVKTGKKSGGKMTTDKSDKSGGKTKTGKKSSGKMRTGKRSKRKTKTGKKVVR